MIVKELLNGGLVQVRHPLLLRAGELQQCDDMLCYPGDPRLRTAPGRTAFGTVRSTAVICVTHGNTSLTSTSAFGTDIASVVVAAGSDVIHKVAAFGSVAIGQTVVGTGIPAGSLVIRVISADDVQISNIATADGTVTVTFSDFHPGTFISGTGITTGTTISSITNASTIVLSATATDSTTGSRTFSEGITGLTAAVFDGSSNDVMLARAAGKLYSAPLTDVTGSFSTLYTGLSQDPEANFETIQFADKHMLLTGYDIPRLIYYKDSGSGTRTLMSRAAGMKAVSEFGDLSIAAGQWSSLTDFQNGWYWFLITEGFNIGEQDEAEGDFNGTPKAVHITDYTTQAIKVTRAVNGGTTPVNDGLYGANTATHWCVYIAPKQADQYPQPDLSSFRRIATVRISDATITIGDSNPFQAGWARTLTTLAGCDTLFPFSSTAALSSVAAQSVASCTVTTDSNAVSSAAGFGTVTFGMFVTGTGIPQGTTVTQVVDSSNLKLSNKATASGTVTLYFGNKPSTDALYSVAPNNNGATYRGGEFTNFGIQNQGSFSTGTITGIRVTITGWYTNKNNQPDLGFFISLRKIGSNTTSDERWISMKQGTNRAGLVTIGDEQDTWGISWSPSDFADGGIGVRLRKHYNSVATTHYIDSIKIEVFAGQSALNMDGTPFRTIIITDQLGNSTGVGAAGTPPNASTGDLINGMIVLNDPNDESSVVGSLPGATPQAYEAYPAGYRLPLEGKYNDKVRAIRRVGNVGVICCLNSITRLNYFPTEADPYNSRGACYERIASDHGVVGPKAVKLITMPEKGELLVYYSHIGLRATDAVTSISLNDDIDWKNLIEPTLIQRTTLEVYPALYLLALYYVPTGGTRKTKALYLSYHPSHIKEGFKLPAFGPISVEGASATNILLNGKPRLFTGHGIDGKVYLEDSGSTDASGGSILPAFRTRRFTVTEIGFTGRIERCFILADAAGNSTTGGFTAAFYRQNQGEAVTLANSDTTKTTVTGGLIELFPDNTVEAADFKFSKDGTQTAALQVHFFAFETMSKAQDTNG